MDSLPETFGGQTAGGVFIFSESGEMTSFVTEDRAATGADGTMDYIPWTARCSDYVTENGVKHPTKMQAVWNYPDGGFVYFDGDTYFFLKNCFEQSAHKIGAERRGLTDANDFLTAIQKEISMRSAASAPLRGTHRTNRRQAAPALFLKAQAPFFSSFAA